MANHQTHEVLHSCFKQQLPLQSKNMKYLTLAARLLQMIISVQETAAAT